MRPFDTPPPAPAYTFSRFGASLRDTLDTLNRELGHLVAHNVVVELDVTEADLRLDGYPRANAKLRSPAVRLSFESHVGPLRYETAEFYTWQDNLRAIALSLEALRKVDRYGVSKRGEQYRGWRALPTGTDPADAIQTREQALSLIAHHAKVEPGFLKSDALLKDALRIAVRRTHPDTDGGDATEFRKVMRAKEILGA